MSMGIGENIKRIRTGMGLSQKAFGDLIGKSESQIGSYENEKTDRSERSARRL